MRYRYRYDGGCMIFLKLLINNIPENHPFISENYRESALCYENIDFLFLLAACNVIDARGT